jgi:DNA-binding transcriptional LysR family regulator
MFNINGVDITSSGSMDLKSFDLNLLLCFDAIHRHQSLSAAGEELGLTQPAVSAALKRLRGHFDNPLFVRTSHGMRPTPYADNMAPRIAQVLDVLRGVDTASEFSPATTRINFRIYINDVGLVVLMPKVLAHLSEHAPMARVTVVDLRPDEVIDALDGGELDLAIGYFLGMPNWARQQNLRTTRYVTLVSQQHPIVGNSLTLEKFLRCRHAVYASTGTLHYGIEQALAQHSLTRDVVLTVPRFAALPLLITGSDMITTVPEDLGTLFTALLPVRQFKPPIDLAPFQIRQYWHQRLHDEPAYRWLRDVVFRLTTRLPSPERRGRRTGEAAR